MLHLPRDMKSTRAPSTPAPSTPAAPQQPGCLQRIAVAVVEHKDRFLVGVRPPGVPLEGYSEFPGGKVRDGETTAEAAERECLEETGLSITVGDLYDCTVHYYAHGVVELHFFAAAAQDPQQAARAPFRWVARNDLPSLRFPPANARVLEVLLAASERPG
jgi:8-oxo-dGTP diphosphatase